MRKMLMGLTLAAAVMSSLTAARPAAAQPGEWQSWSYTWTIQPNGLTHWMPFNMQAGEDVEVYVSGMPSWASGQLGTGIATPAGVVNGTVDAFSSNPITRLHGAATGAGTYQAGFHNYSISPIKITFVVRKRVAVARPSLLGVVSDMPSPP